MESHSIHARPPFPSPSHPAGDAGITTDLHHRIQIYHPGYTTRALLLILQASDHPNGGFHHETARVACGIITGNRWDGYLSATRDGPEVDVARSAVLPAGRYYFQLPPIEQLRQGDLLDSTDAHPPYPIIPKFRDWPFPHDDLPDSWAANLITNLTVDNTPQRSQGSNMLLARDATCRLSGYQEQTTVAHICPQAENEWFQANDMSPYISNIQRSGIRAIDDTANIILLRQDIHAIFDAHRITFVPKSYDGEESQETRIMAHVWAASAELIQLYHNVIVQDLKGISVEFLFARFALSVFSLLDSFLEAGIPRMLRLGGVESPITRMVLPDECIAISKPPRSRHPSPTKKRAPPEPDYTDEIEELGYAYEQQNDETTRGRKRRRIMEQGSRLEHLVNIGDESKGHNERISGNQKRTRPEEQSWLPSSFDGTGVHDEDYRRPTEGKANSGKRRLTKQWLSTPHATGKPFGGQRCVKVGIDNVEEPPGGKPQQQNDAEFSKLSSHSLLSSPPSHGLDSSPPSDTLAASAHNLETPENDKCVPGEAQSPTQFKTSSAETSSDSQPQLPSVTESESQTLPSPSPSPSPLHLQNLISTHLHTERLHSDPSGAWAKEQEWLDDIVTTERPLCAWEVPRLLKGLWGGEGDEGGQMVDDG